MTTAVTAGHFGKSRQLKSQLSKEHSVKMKSQSFSRVCQDMEAGHEALLYHREVRWLSRGKVLQQFFELHRDMAEFIRVKKPDIARFFTNLACLNLNLSIQGGHQFILDAGKEITAFMKKTDLWRRMHDGITE